MKMEYNGFIGNFNSRGAYLEYLEKDGIDLIRKSLDGNSTHGGGAVLFPFGNRVRNAEYTYDNRNYQLPRNDGKNSIHGLVRDLIFDSIECDNYIDIGLGYTMAVFGILSIMAVITFYFIMPETKNKSVEEINDMFEKNQLKDVKNAAESGKSPNAGNK